MTFLHDNKELVKYAHTANLVMIRSNVMRYYSKWKQNNGKIEENTLLDSDTAVLTV